MSFSVRIRLSVMMFLQYFVWGAWFVTLGIYLSSGRKFEGSAIGMCYATIPIAGMISPFFVGIIGDRLFAAEKLLAFLHILGGGIMFYISTGLPDSQVFPFLLAYALCFMPTLSLSNTVAFNQMQDAGRQFPVIRVFGTIGWIVAGMLVGKLRMPANGTLANLQLSMGEAADTAAGLLKIDATTLPMQIAAISSLALGLFCFFLPHTPPKQEANPTFGSIIGLGALRLMTNFSFAIFVLGSFLICIPLQFYYAFTSTFLDAVHFPDPAFSMTFGQISEFFFLLIMPFFFARLGVKYMLLIGMLCWTLRYVLFSFGSVPALYTGIILHGICYDFFFVTGQIYVDQKAPREVRGAAQGFIAFVTLGFGQFVGSVLGGKVLDYFKLPTDPVTYDWVKFWLVPAAGAFVVMLIFAALFSDRDFRDRTSSPDAI